MQVTVPNMGSATIAFKALLEPLGLEVVLPPPISKKTIDLGVKHSPEFVCFPFKVVVGDYIRSLNNGVTNLVSATDHGPCRFGFYHAIQERILRDLGYEFTMYTLPQGDLLEFKWLQVLNTLCEYRGLAKVSAAMKGIKLFMQKAKFIEDIEAAEGRYTCREATKGDTERVKQELLRQLDAINSPSALHGFEKIIKQRFAAMDHVRVDDPLKVFMTGEIYMTLEPYVNRDMKRKLGRLGCEVTQTLSLYDWIMHKFHVNFHRKYMERLARPHMPLDIGGEAVWVLGEYIWAATHGYEGFFHVYPFTCMPEITARGIITNHLVKEHGLPPLFVSLDENTGDAGLITRLEAMCELMREKRRRHSGGDGRQRVDAFLQAEKAQLLAEQRNHRCGKGCSCEEKE